MGSGTSGNNLSSARFSPAVAAAARRRAPPLPADADATRAVSPRARATKTPTRDAFDASNAVERDVARERERVRARAVDKARHPLETPVVVLLVVVEHRASVRIEANARRGRLARFGDAGARVTPTARARVWRQCAPTMTMMTTGTGTSTSTARASRRIRARERRRVDVSRARTLVRRPGRARATREDGDGGKDDEGRMTVGGGDDAARAVSVAERDEGEGAREWGVVTVDDAETTGTMGTRGDEGGHFVVDSIASGREDDDDEVSREDVDDGDEHHEIVYEEYEEEVDYELHDYVADARTALARLRPDFTWGVRAARRSTHGDRVAAVEFLSVNASRTSAAASGALDAHSIVGVVLALGSLWSARAIRMELEKRGARRRRARATREMSGGGTRERGGTSRGASTSGGGRGARAKETTG